MSMKIQNSTRYNTSDIEEILKACGGGSVWHSSFAEARTWLIYYASDSIAMPEGCFVKFNKNGDETSYTKKIALLRPNKVKGLPGIIQMEMMTTGSVSRDMLIELIVRLIAIKDFDRSSHRRSKALPCTDDVRRYLYVKEKAVHILETNPQLQLRFTDKEVKSAELDMRKIHSSLFDNFARCESALAHLKYTLARDESQILSLQNQLVDLQKKIEDDRAKKVKADLEKDKAQKELDDHLEAMARNNFTP